MFSFVEVGPRGRAVSLSVHGERSAEGPLALVSVSLRACSLVARPWPRATEAPFAVTGQFSSLHFSFLEPTLWVKKKKAD